jgi:ribosomal protein S18 acetylase RimI-like enzyme
VVHHPLLIRPARPEDEAFMRATHHAGFRDVVERQFGPWDEAQQDRFFDGFLRDHRADIVELDGVPCGYLALTELDDLVFVNEIVVHPDFQGRGIGRTLLESVIAKGKSVRLGVLFENRARALYEQLGFTIVGQNATHHLMLHADAPEGRSAPHHAT